jgi:hypothetical protein
MDIQTVVREVTVRGSVQGMDQVATAYNNVSSSADDTAASMAKSGSSAAVAEAAIAKLGDQLQDNSRQLAQFNDAMKQQSQAYAQTMSAANDNTEAVKANGLEWAEIANHVRQATEVAYAFSPAFRGVVNAMAVPALAAAGTALEVVAAGLVTGTNLAGTGLVRLGTAAATTIPALAPVGGAVAAVGASLQAFNPSLAGAASTILGSLLPALRLLGPALLIYDAIKLVASAWELGGQKLDEYRQIAEKAAAVDLSTSYFQKLMKGATDSKVPVDQLTLALQNLQKSSADALGGSPLQQRLDASTEAGNFKNNPGVSQLAQANTTQEKYQAIAILIHQAMQDGERLAAIDIAGTAFGPEAADHLRQDSEYFDKINAAAAKISDTQITSDADVGRALALKTQYDAAVAILEQRWHPVQDVLTQLGIQMQIAWVNIVSAIAGAVDGAIKLVQQIGNIPQAFWDYVKSGIHGAATAVATVAPYIPPIGAIGGAVAGAVADATAPVAPVTAYSAAVDKLRAGLQNQNAVQQAVNQTNTVAQKVLGDSSHAIDNQKKEVEDANDAYDRAVNAAQKHYAATNADTDAIGLGAGAMEEFKTKAALTTAALQAQRDMTPALTAEIEAYAKAAGVAAQANALVKANSTANFASQTLFMSPTDLAAANVMHNLYGDDWQAHMDDALAKQLKLNSEIGAAKSLADQLAGAFANDLVSGLLAGKTGMEALTSAANSLGKSLTTAGINNIIKDPTSSTGYIEAGIGLVTQLFTGNDQAKADLAAAQTAWAGMTAQVNAFSLAAKGVTLGPLTNELNSLLATSSQLQQAAAKAKDYSGEQSAADNFSDAVVRIVGEFQAAATPLTALQTSIKGVNDEASGLKATLDQLGYGMDGQIDAAAQAQIAALVAQFTASVTSSLTARLNTANGQDYLNSAQDVLTAHQQDLANAAELGNSPALMAQVSATFAAEAQKVVNDAGLVGDQFNDFIKLFPQFAGVVTQSSTAIASAQANFAALSKTISDYLNSVQLGSNSILSPQDQLSAAQSQFSSQLTLAQSGNTDALGSITQYASTLLDQAKSYYASSSGYDDIYRAVVTALSALTGIGGAVPFNPASALGSSALNSSVSASLPASSSAVLPSTPSASNDNGDYFAAQTQALVSAIGAAATAEVSALQDGIDTLAARLDKVVAAIAANKPKAARPNAKASA